MRALLSALIYAVVSLAVTDCAAGVSNHAQFGMVFISGKVEIFEVSDHGDPGTCVHDKINITAAEYFVRSGCRVERLTGGHYHSSIFLSLWMDFGNKITRDAFIPI